PAEPGPALFRSGLARSSGVSSGCPSGGVAHSAAQDGRDENLLDPVIINLQITATGGKVVKSRGRRADGRSGRSWASGHATPSQLSSPAVILGKPASPPSPGAAVERRDPHFVCHRTRRRARRRAAV